MKTALEVLKSQKQDPWNEATDDYVDSSTAFVIGAMEEYKIQFKESLAQILEAHSTEPIALIGNVDHQKGYRECLSDIHELILKL